MLASARCTPGKFDLDVDATIDQAFPGGASVCKLEQSRCTERINSIVSYAARRFA